MPVIPQVTTTLAGRSLVFHAPLGKSRFSLDASGVAGVFGGEEAVSAMATVHVYEHRKWLGWYNSPGSYGIAQRYGKLAKSKFFNGLFPGVHADPATLFEFDGWVGPKFRAAHSGTVFDKTPHLAALMMKECAEMPSSLKVKGRESRTVGVTIAELRHIPEPEESPRRSRAFAPIYASVPILVSFITCVMCLLVSDWYSFSMILLGIIVSGVSCLVIGSGKFLFKHPKPAKGSPQGDGILCSDEDIIVLRGEEAAVNSITRGKFSLQFDRDPRYQYIGWCSVLLMIQFIAQLLLIPQGTLFGQMMFVASLAVSWAYNLWLSSIDKEKIQREILMKILGGPELIKYDLPTWTSMVVFVLLILQAKEPEKVMDFLLPNDTEPWKKWKDAVIDRLKSAKELNFNKADWDDKNFNDVDKELLETLFQDARDAYKGFKMYCEVSDSKSSQT
ncbi:hypothetical protein M404DRAFT_1003854 [Pisolithus tinctorius Marx 270]|uniref:Uncharacterized protein n=1 Tax=Pisolithus tinctorius Marx 270 TaxID=870435 RepID=A0A0C3IU90_PISTI|nr:hypothetical protein M404DRAFT_1003854 [Pisolithus tinctorius Marx 270]